MRDGKQNTHLQNRPGPGRWPCTSRELLGTSGPHALCMRISAPTPAALGSPDAESLSWDPAVGHREDLVQVDAASPG